MTRVSIMVGKEAPVKVIVLEDSEDSSHFEPKTAKEIEEKVKDVLFLFWCYFLENQVEEFLDFLHQILIDHQSFMHYIVFSRNFILAFFSLQ